MFEAGSILFSNGQDARDLENEAKRTFVRAGFSGFSGATEWYVKDANLVAWLRDHGMKIDVADA